MNDTMTAPATVEPRSLPSIGEAPVTIIAASRGWLRINFKELWSYRELLYFLIWRDVKVRYKQTVLGAAWAILQPLVTMVVFSLFFGRMAGLSSGSIPYPLFVLAGLLPWTFLSNAISGAAQSLIGSQNLVTKVYFPRLLIPMSALGVALADLLVAFGLLIVMMLFYGYPPGFGVLLTPLLLLGLLVTALGMGTLLAALTVAYRDFRYIVPFLVQTWMLATPAIYARTDTLISERWDPWLALNPAHGFILGFRSAMLGSAVVPGTLLISSVCALTLLFAGCVYFARVERSFADVI